jgi:hypothetical protein
MSMLFFRRKVRKGGALVKPGIRAWWRKRGFEGAGEADSRSLDMAMVGGGWGGWMGGDAEDMRVDTVRGWRAESCAGWMGSNSENTLMCNCAVRRKSKRPTKYLVKSSTGPCKPDTAGTFQQS